MNLKENIKSLADECYPEVVKMRRHIHANPELSFEEHETSAFVARQLEALQIEVQEGFAGTGLTGLIRGGKASFGQPEKTIALRADMEQAAAWGSAQLAGTERRRQPQWTRRRAGGGSSETDEA